MSCGLTSERLDKPINVAVLRWKPSPLRWKVSTLRWKASNGSDGKTKGLRWKITPHSNKMMPSSPDFVAFARD